MYQKIFSLLIFLFIGCAKPYNTSSKDREDYSPIPTGSIEYTTAMEVIRNNCTSCHYLWSNLEASEFVSQNLITPNSLAESKIYYRLNGVTEGPGLKNMPSGNSLSVDEIKAIADWINSF